MSYQPKLVSNFSTGLQNDIEPFLLMDDAFENLENAYLFRGRLKRREGFRLLGRFRRVLVGQALGNSAGASTSFDVKTLLGLETNASIEPGTVTVDVAAPGVSQFTEPATPDGTLVGTGSGTTGTINYATGDITLNFSGAIGASATTIDFSYFPALPAMGLAQRDITSINAEQTVGFDTVYAYVYNNSTAGWEEWIAGTTWTGSNSDFFWTTNYWQDANQNGLLWATNFVQLDPIRYTNGTAWTNFAPLWTANDTLYQARIILPFKGRLVMFNTWEGTTAGGAAAAVQFPQRCRFSQVGDPTVATAWRQDTVGLGGFIDAPTNEHIVAASYIRDQLMVQFERSTWNLRYTGNELLPFVFERVDSELGAESTFSPVRFDKGVLSVGHNGITSSSGTSVERIDEKIPDVVFNFHNGNDGPLRVHGIRDFIKQLVYWTYPNDDQNGTYPNRMLVFDYERGSWAIFRDSFTVFGRNQSFSDARWQDFPTTSWEEANFTWNDAALQSGFSDVIAGNQQGYVLLLNKQTTNEQSLQITDLTAGTPAIVTSPSHNLETGDFVLLSGILGTSSVLNGTTYRVTVTGVDTFTIAEWDASISAFVSVTLAGGSTYLGAGVIRTVQNFFVRTKMFNLFEAGVGAHMGYIDFLTRATSSGQFTCEVFGGYQQSSPLNAGSDPFFNRTVSTTDAAASVDQESQVWQRFYCYTDFTSGQFQFDLSDAQMVDQSINGSEVQIAALIMWLAKGGRLVR